MLSVLLVFLLTSPCPASPPVCRWYDPHAQRCRDEDVEYLGTWDPRPSQSEWPRNNAYAMTPMPPGPWGTYPTERQP